MYSYLIIFCIADIAISNYGEGSGLDDGSCVGGEGLAQWARSGRWVMCWW